MRFLDYDIPIGVSLNHEFHLQLVDDYVAHGFTHFEYQLPVSRDGNRASTEAVLNQVLPLNQKLAEHNLCPWSIHLPFMPVGM